MRLHWCYRVLNGSESSLIACRCTVPGVGMKVAVAGELQLRMLLLQTGVWVLLG